MDISAGVIPGVSPYSISSFFPHNTTGTVPATLFRPRHERITSRLCHSDVSLLLSLVVAFKVTNMFTRTYSNPRASARVWVSEGCESTVYTRYFYRQPRLSGGQRPEKWWRRSWFGQSLYCCRIIWQRSDWTTSAFRLAMVFSHLSHFIQTILRSDTEIKDEEVDRVQ